MERCHLQVSLALEGVCVLSGRGGRAPGQRHAVLQLWSCRCSLQVPDMAEQVTFKDYRAVVWAVDGETS